MSLTYNWNIDGHEGVLKLLESDLAEKNLAHAYLFSGPKGVGKFTAAKIMAHILQCENEYCHTCAVCNEIEKGYHSDTIEFRDEGESIKIEQIRGVLEKLHMSKHAPYKILLVQDIERMTGESANALLKTLEDPPDNVIFLLTTSSVKEVLPTILSRVRLLKFRRVADADIAALIRKHYPHADQLTIETVCAFSLGRAGRALSFMQDDDLYRSYRKIFDDIEFFLQKPDRAQQFTYIGELVALQKERDDETIIQDFLEVFLVVLRKQLLMKANGNRAIVSQEKILEAISRAQQSRELLKRNVNARLLLENMLLPLTTKNS